MSRDSINSWGATTRRFSSYKGELGYKGYDNDARVGTRRGKERYVFNGSGSGREQCLNE